MPMRSTGVDPIWVSTPAFIGQIVLEGAVESISRPPSALIGLPIDASAAAQFDLDLAPTPAFIAAARLGTKDVP